MATITDNIDATCLSSKVSLTSPSPTAAADGDVNRPDANIFLVSEALNIAHATATVSPGTVLFFFF